MKQQNKPNKSGFHIFVTILLFLIVSYRFSFTANNRLDDAFITFRVAYNLYEHGQFVYNLGEYYLVTTSPLYAIFLAPFFSFIPFEDIPLLANVFSAIFIFLSAFLVYYYYIKNNQPIIGTILSIMMVSLNYPYFFLGLETNFFIFLIILSSYIFSERKFFICGILCGLTFLARGDGIILAGIFLVYTLIKEKKELTPLIKGLCAVLLPWAIFSKLYFGSFFPSTLKTKIIQGTTRMFGPNFRDTIFSGEFFPYLVNNRLIEVIFLIISIVSLLFLFKKIFLKNINTAEFFSFSIILFGFLQTIGYALLNVAGNYFWYKIPLMISVIFGFSLFADKIINLFSTKLYKNPKAITYQFCVIILSIILAYGLNITTWYSPPWTGNLGDTYINAADYLIKISGPEDTIELGEGGIIGYYLRDRKIIDYFGVITPWILKKGYDTHDYITAVTKQTKPKFIITTALPESLKKDYSLIRSFETGYVEWTVGVYELKFNGNV